MNKAQSVQHSDVSVVDTDYDNTEVGQEELIQVDANDDRSSREDNDQHDGKGTSVPDMKEIIPIDVDDGVTDKNIVREELIQVQGDGRLGDMRKLISSESKMLQRLGVDMDPELTKNENCLIMVAHFLIIVSATSRIVITAMLPEESKLENLSPMDEECLDKLLDLKKKHVIMSTIVAKIFLPHLFLFGLVPEGRVTLFLQILMSIATFVLTIANAQVQNGIMNTYDNKSCLYFQVNNLTDCQGRKSCNHHSTSWVLLVTIIAFVLITILRILFRTKIKNLILGFKVLGPCIKFITSRRGRDFVAITMLLFLTLSITSGTVLNMGFKFRMQVYDKEDVKTRIFEAIFDTITTLVTVTWLMLLFWIYAQVHHRFTHSLLVEEDMLEEELERLGEEYKDTLMGHDASMYGYHPLSQHPDCPVDSGHKYSGCKHR